MKYKNGDTIHVRVKIKDAGTRSPAVLVEYGVVPFLVSVGDITKLEPRAIGPGDMVRHISYPLSNSWRMEVESISIDGKWAWLKTTYKDQTIRYLTYTVDSLMMVDND